MHPPLKRKNYVAPAVHFREISQFLFYFISICLEDLKAYSFESHARTFKRGHMLNLRSCSFTSPELCFFFRVAARERNWIRW